MSTFVLFVATVQKQIKQFFIKLYCLLFIFTHMICEVFMVAFMHRGSQRSLGGT